MIKRVITWNIRHGGGSNLGPRLPIVVSQALRFDADVLVLTEFRRGTAGDVIRSNLTDAGFLLSFPDIAPGINTVLVASKDPIVSSRPFNIALPDQRHLWLVEIDWLVLCAAYFPQGKAKLPYWQSLIESETQEPSAELFIGDFNTGDNVMDLTPGATKFEASEAFKRFGQGKYKDVWRNINPNLREYSWYSNPGKNGFRIDHAFAVDSLRQRIRSCVFDQTPRIDNLSDHAALIMEIER